MPNRETIPRLPQLLFVLLFLLAALLQASPQGEAMEQRAVQVGDTTAPIHGYDELGAPVRPEEVGSGSLLLATSHPGLYLPAPTQETEISVRISGLVARATVRQRFTNPTELWVEGIYVFPLPEDSAVDRLRMRVGERVIEGVIEEREEAEKIYEKAKRAGKKASLVEQERPNLFTTSVANLGPGETVEVEIGYQEELSYTAGSLTAGRFTLRLPLVVAPRFIPGTPTETAAHGAGGGGSGWAPATDRVPDAPRITPPVAPPGDNPDAGPRNPVRIEVLLDAGFPLETVASPSHELSIGALDGRSGGPGSEEVLAGGRVAVELAGGRVAADRDFVLHWRPQLGHAPQAALFCERGRSASGGGSPGDRYCLLMVLPPTAEAGRSERLARDVTFVIDTSGSMHGASIAQAKSALELALAGLAREDRFNIVRFASDAEKLFPAPVPAEPAAVTRAQRWVGGLDAEGGTNIMAALDAALGSDGAARGGESAAALSQVVFITDGSVGNEEELFRAIDRRLGADRLFTVGIGSAPNGHFMRRAAQHGRGTFTYIGSPREVEPRMVELFHKLESPVMADLAVAWDSPGAETLPERLPDLYAGEPLVSVARLPAGDGAYPLPPSVTVSGVRSRLPWSVHLTADPAAGADTGAAAEGVAKLWARRRIAGLMDGLARGRQAAAVRDAVLAVALEHQLVSRYTSLVAVDLTPTAPAGETPATRPIPLNLPAGWSYERVFSSLPQGGTAAGLWSLIGLMGLLGALVLYRFGGGRW